MTLRPYLCTIRQTNWCQSYDGRQNIPRNFLGTQTPRLPGKLIQSLTAAFQGASSELKHNIKVIFGSLCSSGSSLKTSLCQSMRSHLRKHSVKLLQSFLSLLNLTKECRVLNVGQSFEKFFSSRVWQIGWRWVRLVTCDFNTTHYQKLTNIIWIYRAV